MKAIFDSIKQDSMQKLYFLLYLLLSVPFSQAQSIKHTGNLQHTITKVIQGFPNHFSDIKGELLEQDGQQRVYATTTAMAGTPGATVTQYGTDEEHMLSWKNILADEEDFEKAAALFHTYYNELKKLSVNSGETNLHFRAPYDAPEETRKFTTILFTTDEAAVFENVVLDLSMQYVLGIWQLSISMYKLVDTE